MGALLLFRLHDLSLGKVDSTRILTFSAVAIDVESAYFSYILFASVTPATDFMMAMPFLVGDQYQALTWTVFVSSVLIMIGVLVYKGDDLDLPCLKKKQNFEALPSSDEETALLGASLQSIQNN